MQYNKRIFDKKKIEHREIDIISWKQSNKNPGNYENFQAFYMIKMYLTNRNSDNNIKVVFDNKYKVVKFLNILLDNKSFSVNGIIHGEEKELLSLKKEYFNIIDPIIEKKRKESWKGFFNE